MLSNLRNEEVEKKKKLKLLRNLSDKNNITQDLSLKINNYIKETSVIKKKFDAEENKKFVSHLP